MKKFLSPAKTGLFAAVLAVAALSGCANLPNGDSAQPEGNRQFNVLAVNDIYNAEGVDAQQKGGFARLRALRRQLGGKDNPALLLLAGDFLFPSSMSSQYQGEQMIDLMNLLDGDKDGFDERFYVAFGNHEFDKKAIKYADIIGKRIEQSDFYWLGGNVALAKEATRDSPRFAKALLANAVTTINGVKVGLFSITTNMAVPEYAVIDGDYAAFAKRQIAALKARGAQVIIALTHLKISDDQKLLEQLGDQGPDVIFGGHEHNRQHQCVGKRCVIKADADARSATVATIAVAPSGAVSVDFRYAIIDDSTIDGDPMVAARTKDWLVRYEEEYCAKNQRAKGCLREVLGKTSTELIAEELEIRRYETNLGAYVADQMIKAFDGVRLPGNRKVQIALINSGSLRLNQNIPAGADLTQWSLNALFQYPVGLRLLDITGAQLRQVVDHAISDWTGNGWWLQHAGIAFRHDTKNGVASDLHLIDGKGNKTLVKDQDKILAAVADYIASPQNGDQDGYAMLKAENAVPYEGKMIDLKTVVSEAIKSQWQNKKAIGPVLPGRVCSSDRASLPCVLD